MPGEDPDSRNADPPSRAVAPDARAQKPARSPGLRFVGADATNPFALSALDLAGDSHDWPFQTRRSLGQATPRQARRLDGAARLSRAGRRAIPRLVEEGEAR